MKENTMGKKIRALRLEKGMTQAALAGDTVTRNMLSQIENGLAQPSVTTILELSERLGVPTEYFFSDCEDVSVFRKIEAIDKIRKAFADGDWGKCIYRLEHLGVSDEETEYLWAESYFAAAVSLYREGKLRSADDYLKKARMHAEKTHYVSEGLLCAIHRYESAIRFVRDKETADGLTIPEEMRGCMADLDYIKTLAGAQSVKSGGDLYTKHLEIRARMDADDPKTLSDELRALLDDPCAGDFAALRYYVLGDMEALAQRSGDYKTAYECAAARLAISEKMNT